MLSNSNSNPASSPTPTDPIAGRILALSTCAFTLMFAVWLMFGILSIPLRAEMKLSPVQLSWLAAIAILNGSIWRLLAGILTDRFGGRRMFIALILMTAVPTFMVSYAQNYTQLMICAFLLGLAGNSFSVGIAWNAAWFPPHRQGLALGVFGAGNVGASVTKLIGPGLIAAVPMAGWMSGAIPGGWRFIPFLYGVLLLIMASLVWSLAPVADRMPGRGRPLVQMLRPMRNIRVWRFSLYYVVVFGAYVALSLWLPRYYTDVYGLPLGTAAMLTACFIFPASLLRPLGGYLSDRVGARRVMYWVFGAMTLASLLLMLPPMRIEIPRLAGPTLTLSFGLNVWTFTATLLLIAISMGIGKAAVYKYIPQYFPDDVGAVGGLVGLLGALGGFVLPPLFAYTEKLSGFPQVAFFALFVFNAASLLWFHITVLQLTRQEAAHVRDEFEAAFRPVAAGK
jgi:MFS transporter, NNP family, nitrate/nitrite transporter